MGTKAHTKQVFRTLFPKKLECCLKYESKTEANGTHVTLYLILNVAAKLKLPVQYCVAWSAAMFTWVVSVRVQSKICIMPEPKVFLQNFAC